MTFLLPDFQEFDLIIVTFLCHFVLIAFSGHKGPSDPSLILIALNTLDLF